MSDAGLGRLRSRLFAHVILSCIIPFTSSMASNLLRACTHLFGCSNIFDHAAKANQSKYPRAQCITSIGLLKRIKGRWACPALYPQVAPQRVAQWSYARRALRRNGCSIAKKRNAADGRRAARLPVRVRTQTGPKGTLAHGPYLRCGACQWNNHWLHTAPWSDPRARVL